MKNLCKALPFFFLFMFSAPSCKTLPPAIQEGGSKVIDCAKGSIAEIAKDNLMNVQLELLQGNWKDLLQADAVKLGSDVVACLVEYIVTGSRKDSMMAASDPNAHARAVRGQEWLDGQKVLFQRKLQP